MSLQSGSRLVWIALVLVATATPAAGAEFTATYRELAPSPASFGTVWYSGAVTRDGKFVYGLGQNHNSFGNNSLWLYDPATDTHKNLFQDTGSKWLWDKDADGKTIPKSGRWSDPSIRAITNRNNHQAFYVAGRNEFWVLAGTTFYQSSPYFGGRFSLDSNRWEYLSPPWGQKKVSDLADFSAGLIAGQGGWVSPNAATAVCSDIDTVVLFGGMNGTGGVRIIEPNPTGPEPYRWASAPRPPFHQPAENVRHNAVCAGDNVYFVAGQERVRGVKCCRTPDPAPFWKFHVPSRTWTRLVEGPAGAYFTVMTHDSGVGALLVYGGSAGPEPANRLWVYDLRTDAWHDLTGTVPNLPRADMHTGGFVPGFGHVYKGGRRFDESGRDMGYAASARMMAIMLRRGHGADGPAPLAAARRTGADSAPATPTVTAPDRRQLAAAHQTTKQAAAKPSAPPRRKAAAALRAPTVASGGAIRWTKIPLPGSPDSPEGSMKHQRLVEGPGGRVYLLGGDWGGLDQLHIGRQEVYSFDPLSPTGDWKLEAPYCGTVENPVHWHTDEAGLGWDAERKVFWKLAGTEYGPDSKNPAHPRYDTCFAAGKSVKAKVITWSPETRLWSVPPHVAQSRFGYVTNGVLDTDKDQMVQIVDNAAKHLDLAGGKWTSYPLPSGPLRFNAIVSRIGRTLWWVNREEVLESYDLDTHKLAGHGQWPFPRRDGWGMAMTFASGDKVLAVWPTAGPAQQRFSALYDPAKKQWSKLDQGAGWGNAGVMHSSGKLVLMGGGINGPPDHNKFLWVGEVP